MTHAQTLFYGAFGVEAGEVRSSREKKPHALKRKNPIDSALLGYQCDDIELLDAALFISTDADIYHRQKILGATTLGRAITRPAGDEELLESVSHRRPFSNFAGSKETVKAFRNFYNGQGVRRIARLLAGASIDTAEAEDILSDVLEDALIGVLVTLGDSHSILRLEDARFVVVATAVAERLPGIPDERADLISRQLVRDLTNRLNSGDVLVIDGGAVVYDNGLICLLSKTNAKS